MDQSNAEIIHEEAKQLLLEIATSENIINPKITIGNAVQKGENYAGIILKGEINGDNKTLKLILKCAPRDPVIRQMIQTEICFGQENYFYQKIAPAFEKFAAFTSFPKCNKIVDTVGKEMIVLEDIRESGYVMKDKKVKLDREHVARVLEEYGRLHAVSFAMKDQKKEDFQELVGGLWEVFSTQTTNMEFFDIFKAIANEIVVLCADEKDGEFKKAVCNIGEGVMPFFEKLDQFKREEGVIVHGDSWSNNMMFKYNDESNPSKPTHVCFLDFQISKSVPPSIDLAYFLYANAPEEIINNLEQYLKIYYNSLCENVKLLGSNIEGLYSFEKLKEDWKEYSMFGFYMALLVTRVMLTDVEDVLDFGDVDGDKNPTDILVRSKVKNEGLIQERWMFLTKHMYENKFISF